MIGSKTLAQHNLILPIFALIIIAQFAPSISQPNFTILNCSNSSGNYTQNSTFHTNLNSLLSSLPSNINSYGFFNTSIGQEPDRVSATVQCRGDLDRQTCLQCANNSVYKIVQVCPNQRQAIGWYDECTVMYSNASILGVLLTEPFIRGCSPLTSGNAVSYDEEIRRLALNLEEVAPWGSEMKFATVSSNKSGIESIYMLMQCVPSISPGDCNFCLRIAVNFSQHCSGRQGARVVGPSCTFRNEIFPFYNATWNQTSPPPSSPGKSGKRRTTIIVICAFLGSLLLVLSACIFIFRRKWNKRRKGEQLGAEADADDLKTVETTHYDFREIRDATDDFSNANLLGRGGFGAVYKGTLSDGKVIAVKRLSHDSGQGEVEFRNEVLLVAKLQHKSLVRLLGFCLEKTERLLVYEFMSNGSLDRLLFDAAKRSEFNWYERYRVIESVGRGLLYLHEDSRLKIIHRDLKASNVLLDEEMNAKISDFGMARLVHLDESVTNTNKIVGTYGYMAPEYALHGLFSDKSDVFSYGVLVLEIISGRKNAYFREGQNVEDLLSYTWKCWLRREALDIVDPMLKEAGSGSNQDILRCIHIGLLCVQANITTRPNMASVVLMLHSFSTSLPAPAEPAYFTHGRSISTDDHGRSISTDQSRRSEEEVVPRNFTATAVSDQSFNQASITDLHPR